MPFDRFLIAPFSTGLQQNTRPWLIMDDAFFELNNAYVFRGRIVKRFGSQLTGSGAAGSNTAPLLSRLRINLGNTDGSGDISTTAPGAIFKIGQMFSVGDEIFTVYQTGAPANMLTTGAATVYTYNTTTGAVVINGAAAATPLYFYPAEPVMGLTTYEVGPITNQPAYGFDTQFAYTYNGTSWQRSGSGVTPIWNGDNANFFWTVNWRGLTADIVTLFVTNFNATVPGPGASDDPLWSFDGTTWSEFRPVFLSDGSYVQTARLIVQFKDRLVLLNTIERINPGGTNTNKSFPQRARFSHNGSPFPADVPSVGSSAWLEPNQTFMGSNADGAGFIDATTEEEIISAEFIKDHLIVYFERSTWELVYTGNQVLPFVWQKINTELGSEASFSTVPFDKQILTMGTTGVHACNGANVERIDTKIPDEIFSIQNKNEGVSRVAGIRDYFTELVYWTFPSSDDRQFSNNYAYPNRVLVYNYRNDSWAINYDCFTCFGYFEQQTDTTWATANTTWQNANYTWNSGIIEAQFRQIIAGNQEGFVVIINPTLATNANAMQLTNISVAYPNATLTIVDHTLDNYSNYGVNIGDFIAIETAQGLTFTPNPSTPNVSNIFQVIDVVDSNNVIVYNPNITITGTYLGGGTIRRVSNIGLLSKQWNPYVQKDRNVYLAKIDFGVMRTEHGELTVDYFPSSTIVSMLQEGGSLGTNCLVSNGVLETKAYASVPLEDQQARLWHPLYFQTEGQCIQIYMYMSFDQITQNIIADEDFELEAITLFTQPTSQRLQ